MNANGALVTSAPLGARQPRVTRPRRRPGVPRRKPATPWFALSTTVPCRLAPVGFAPISIPTLSLTVVSTTPLESTTVTVTGGPSLLPVSAPAGIEICSDCVAARSAVGTNSTSASLAPIHRRGTETPPFKTDEPTVVGGLSAGQVSARRPQWEHGETYPPECVDGGRCTRLSVDLRGAGSSYMSASSERVATNTAAATAPAAGIVSTHAQTLRPAIPQRTARDRKSVV